MIQAEKVVSIKSVVFHGQVGKSNTALFKLEKTWLICPDAVVAF
mgnify:CR=1 FL=1